MQKKKAIQKKVIDRIERLIDQEIIWRSLSTSLNRNLMKADKQKGVNAEIVDSPLAQRTS